MQSNRTLVVVLLLAALLGGYLTWQAMSAPEPLAPPEAGAGTEGAGKEPGQAEAATLETGDAEPREGALNRQVAKDGDQATSGLPAIVGQVVAPNGQPVVGAEVVCRPGSGFGMNFDDLGSIDLGAFVPEKIAERSRARRDSQVVVQTDAQGRFRARVEGAGKKISLRVMMRGYRRLDHVATRPQDEDVDVGALQLEIGAVITGRVVDSFGNSVAGARVSRMTQVEQAMPSGFDVNLPGSDLFEDMQQGESTHTDAQGRFELRHAAAGELTLRARHPEYPTAKRAGLSVLAGRTLADVLITMPQSAEIRGVVQGLSESDSGIVVMASKKPVAKEGDGLAGLIGDASELFGDMGMSFGERQSEIGADGAFVLKGLQPNQTYRVWLAQTTKGQPFGAASVSSERQEVLAGATGVVLQYAPGVTVTFVVVADATGEPLENLWVRHRLIGGSSMVFGLAGMRGMVSQESNYPGGRVTLSHLRPKEKQRLDLQIEAKGHAQLEEEVSLPQQGVVDLGILRLEAVARLQVTVLGNDDRPVRGARVALQPEIVRYGMFQGIGQSPNKGLTDGDGNCAVNALVGAPGNLFVHADGYAQMKVPATGEGDPVRKQVVRLLVGGEVHVTVRGPDGSPSAGVSVSRQSDPGSSDKRVTDEAGVARFPNLVPGEHRFRLSPKSGILGQLSPDRNDPRFAWQTVAVQNEQVATVSFEKSSRASVSGVVRENGVVLEDATVAFERGAGGGGGDEREAAARLLRSLGRGGGQSVKTDEAGEYEMSDLPSGEHRLRVTHKGRAMATTVAVRLFDGDNRCDVELTTATIFGVVRDAAGKPLAGASVSAVLVRQGAGELGELGEIGNMMAGMLGDRGRGGSGIVSDRDGKFTLRGVAPDVPVSVQAKKAGLVTATAVATAALGQEKGPIELQLMPGGKIVVSTKKRRGFATVRAKYVGTDGKAAPVMKMMRKKQVTLDSLRPGTWEVSLLSMMSRPEDAPKQTVTVVAGESASVTF